ncbi:uncharacterized protein LOC111701785 [Eurytemora carolleeae]|uniref:uncharacterized protein LOC111701785 n=1 Tax=Eurytemora carolleeae TaxID=1294199 RepID=UPI000C7716D9|nr:uncharacterized protein LOC111701785 [Eurytemora carolleeae]|eukprot:XP_023328975.1 uncharacterized protein LOC111701785 [Eurytemora affinis]
MFTILPSKLFRSSPTIITEIDLNFRCKERRSLFHSNSGGHVTGKLSARTRSTLPNQTTEFKEPSSGGTKIVPIANLKTNSALEESASINLHHNNVTRNGEDGEQSAVVDNQKTVETDDINKVKQIQEEENVSKPKEDVENEILTEEVDKESEADPNVENQPEDPNNNDDLENTGKHSEDVNGDNATSEFEESNITNSNKDIIEEKDEKDFTSTELNRSMKRLGWDSTLRTKIKDTPNGWILVPV